MSWRIKETKAKGREVGKTRKKRELYKGFHWDKQKLFFKKEIKWYVV